MFMYNRLKKAVSVMAALAVSAGTVPGLAPAASAAANAPKYQTNARQMEQLNRGLVAAYRSVDGVNVKSGEGGVYLSWRLLGDESLENQAFDIYRSTSKDGAYTLIHTTGAHDATNYIDTSGSKSNYYKVVKKGGDPSGETAAVPGTNYAAQTSAVNSGYSHINSFTYVDIPIDRPDPVTRYDGKTSKYYSDDSSEGGANDGSIGDLDGDGDYEIVLKWDPSDSKDSAGADYTGRVYIDAYEIDPNNGGRKWRIDLGQNITAGAHYTQFIVYDFDGDGRAEVAMATAPGTLDGTGHYVTEVGDTEEIRKADNTAVNIGTSGSTKGRNMGSEYYTIFDGETGAALATTAAIPLGTSKEWGDEKYNRASRFLAGVAYLDGVHPSYIACRGYYNKAVLRAYTWDGETLSMQWEHNGSTNNSSTMYGQGNHNLSISDIDNDGYDEIVYGSAALDQDGKTVLGNTRLGHGDAIHTSDFNNDGIQETYSVKEEKNGYKTYAEDLRTPKDGKHFWASGTITTSGDNGRGVMANVDDAYAKKQYDAGNSNALALCWSSGKDKTHDLSGADVATKPAAAGNGSFDNSLIYWDGDLSRELLDSNIIQKYDASTGSTKRFYSSSNGYTLAGGSTNNYTKRNATLTADIWGDWREEVILPYNKSSSGQAYLRIYTSTIPTDYRLTTLMHDCQYRMNVAIQNVGYNQPPHTSYYIGSVALATESDGTALNYLAPATAYTKVTYEQADKISVTGITLPQDSVKVELGKEYQLTANIEPADATRKAISWSSSDTSVAKVVNGTVTGVGTGTATITAVTKDGGYKASCEVNVWSTPVTGIKTKEAVSVGVGCSKPLEATVQPDNASVSDVKWSSSNTSAVTVDDEGNITGVSTGAAIITATSVDGGYSAKCVVNAAPLTSNDVTGTESFVTEERDSGVTYSNVSANSVTMTSSSSPCGSEAYKTFEKLSDNHARLSFRITTGGQKNASDNWNWDGREYTFGIQLSDENGNNILTLEQPYAAATDANLSNGAKALTSKCGSNDTQNFTSDWSAIKDGIGNIQGSAKRWILTIDFDYDNSTAKADIIGTDSTWTANNGEYCKEFDLEGLTLGKLRLYTTVDGDGNVSANPQLSDLSYESMTVTEGASTTLYEKGTQWYNAWSSNDIADWTVSGATLNYDETAADNGRVYFNTTKPGTAYSAVKTFTVDDNATVTYDVNWYFGNATGRLSNKEYIQFGNKLRLGWSNSNEGGYCVLASLDGGASYEGVTSTTDDSGTTAVTVDSSKKLFSGANEQYTKNIKLVYDKATNTIKSLTFDGKEISDYTNYKLEDSMNKVTFGFERGGSTNAWEYHCGLDSILVSQFVEGATPVIPTEAPTPSPTPSPSPSPSPSPTPTPTPKPITHDVTAFTAVSRVTVTNGTDAENTITFTESSDANKGVAYAYADISKYIEGQSEYKIEYDSYLTTGSRAKIELSALSSRPGGTNKSTYDKTGIAWCQGVVDSSSYAVNGDKNTYGNAPGARDTWVHTVLTVNTKNKTVSYTVTDYAGASLLSGKELAFLDSTMDAPTGLAFVDWIDNAVSYIKNIKVTTYEPYAEATPTPSAKPTVSPTAKPTEEPAKEKISVTEFGEKDGQLVASVANPDGVANTLSIFAAVYNSNGTLKSVKVYSEAVSGDTTLTAELPSAEDGEYVKAYIWNMTLNNTSMFSKYDSREGTANMTSNALESDEETENAEISSDTADKTAEDTVIEENSGISAEAVTDTDTEAGED